MTEYEREVELCRIWFNSHLTDEDRDWLRGHLDLADVHVPVVDISWVQMERASW